MVTLSYRLINLIEDPAVPKSNILNRNISKSSTILTSVSSSHFPPHSLSFCVASYKGASVSDFVIALKRCFEQGVSVLLFPDIIRGLISTSSTQYCTSSLPNHRMREGKISIRASDFVQSVNEIRPAVALQHNIISLLVDNSVSEVKHVLLCVEAIQRRLINTVLMPYIDTSGRHRNHGRTNGDESNGSRSRSLSRQKGLSLSHCSGKQEGKGGEG